MNRRNTAGFTLVELVIAMLVVAILSAIAMPQYSEYVARQRRIDARTALTLAAQWMERYRAENRGAYTGAALPADYASSPQSGPPLYDLTLANLTATTYRIEATPRSDGPMSGDACAVMTLASDGQRTAAAATSGSLFERCWTR